MGNVSSADHDKVNEPLARRAKKKIGVIGDRKQTKQHDRSSAGYSTSPGQSTSPQEASLSPLSSRQKSSPVSAKGPKPVFTDDVNQHNRPLSQAEFYAKSLAEYSPLTPTSPTTSFSIPSSVATAAPNSPAHDPYSILFTPSPSTQDLPKLSLPTTIPAMMPPGHPQQQQHSPHESMVLPLPLNIDDHAHYRQQQLHLSADLRHLGTSPEAKDWLKQKPTRSSSHMIHQYNFHSQQYYQPPGSALVVNNICRTMSGPAKVPTLHRINTSTGPISGTDVNTSEVSVLTSAASKPRPTSIAAAATAIASAELGTGQEDVHQGPPAETREKEDIPASGSAEVGPRVPTLPIRPTPSRFDSHIDGHGHGYGHSTSALSVSTHPRTAVSRTVRKEPRIGRLVMSRSKLNSPSVSSFSSAMSSSSSCHSTESTPGSPMDCESPDTQLRPCILPASVHRHLPPPPSNPPAHQNRLP